MRRRLVVAFLAVVFVAVVLAGLGGYVLVNNANRRVAANTDLATANNLITRVKNAEGNVKGVDCKSAPPTVGCTRRLLNLIRLAGEVDGAVLILITSNGSINGAVLPDHLTVNDIQVNRLLAGDPVAGTVGSATFAAVPIENTLVANGEFGGELPVVLVTKTTNAPAGEAMYFLIASSISLALAAIVAFWLASRISRPVTGAVKATSQIAKGDFATRVPIVPHEYPEFAILSSSINEMASALERSRDLERQFFMSISHDLRTPLTSIRGYAEAIADGAATDPKAAALVIAGESRRLQRLVQDLLDLARLDANHFKVNIGTIDAVAMITSIGEAFKPMFEEANLNLVVKDGEAAPILLKGDPDRVAQMIGNLVENAYKYARSKVEISIATRNLYSQRESYLIVVSDDGPGISQEDLPFIFDRMFSSTRHVARSGGSGLGLAIVSELANAMGGKVEARSPISGGGGTSIVLELPVA